VTVGGVDLTDWPGADGREIRVASPDGALIAVFATEAPPGDRSPLVLVHGATADHTTWRTSGPLLGRRHALFAIDRRGRGGSSDGPADEPYAIEREFEDVAAVVDTVARETGRPVDVVGHSYGGRAGLGAALLTPNLRRLVVYEGAPPAPGPRGYQDPDAEALTRIERLVGEDDRDEALATFMREIVGMPEPELAAFRSNPIWPRRAAAVKTTIRELRAETSTAGSLDTLGDVRQPVLQILGGDSPPPFADATDALDARLPNGRVVTIAGARHAAHHTHAKTFVAAVEAFLADPDVADSAP
jgi:pimeloyl-ACP methyl ester carboxylesterase